VIATVGVAPFTPLPVYERGLYFDGVDDYIVVTRLIPHHSNTAWGWIRTAADGTIYSINREQFASQGDEDWLTFSVVAGVPIVRYAHGVDEQFSFAGTAQVADSNWHIVAWCMMLTDGSSTLVRVSVDGISNGT
jgi:hypothetical protein